MRRILLLYLALAVLVTAPGSLLTGFRTIGSPFGDLQQHLWSLWWNVEAPVFRLQSPLHTTLLAYPEGGDLYPIDLTGVMLTLPVQLLLPGRLAPSIAVAHNLRVLFEMVLAGWGAFLLARLYTRSTAPAVAAGAIFAFSPYMLGSLENGVTELLGIGWIPLSLWGLHQARRTGRWVPAGLLLAMAALTNWYYAVAMALLVPLWVAARPCRATLLACLLALLLVAPFAQGFRQYLQSPRLLSSHPVGGRSLQDIAPAALAEHLLPGKDPPRPEWPYHHTAYLGWAATALALAGVGRRGLFWQSAGVVFAVLALGPRLGEMALPFSWLAERLPFLGSMNFPYRLVVVATLAVAVLSGLALSRLPRRWQPRAAVASVALIMVETLALSPAPWPLSTTEARLPAAIQRMSLDRGHPVMPLPAFARTLPKTRSEGDHNRLLYKYTWGRYAYQATVHGGALPYGVQDRFPDFLHRNPLTAYVFTREQGGDAPADGLEEGAADLARQGYRWLVLDGSMLAEPIDLPLGAPVAPGRVEAWWLNQSATPAASDRATSP